MHGKHERLSSVEDKQQTVGAARLYIQSTTLMSCHAHCTSNSSGGNWPESLVRREGFESSFYYSVSPTRVITVPSTSQVSPAALHATAHRDWFVGWSAVLRSSNMLVYLRIVARCPSNTLVYLRIVARRLSNVVVYLRIVAERPNNVVMYLRIVAKRPSNTLVYMRIVAKRPSSMPVYLRIIAKRLSNMRVYLRDGSAQTIFTCCHIETEVADQTFHPTQSQYTDTGPTSPGTDPITPGAWQGIGMTRPQKNPGASGIRTRDLPFSRRTP